MESNKTTDFTDMKNIPVEVASMTNQLADIDTEVRSICEQGDKLRRDYLLHRETFEVLLRVCDKCNQISLLAMQAMSLMEGLRRNG